MTPASEKPLNSPEIKSKPVSAPESPQVSPDDYIFETPDYDEAVREPEAGMQQVSPRPKPEPVSPNSTLSRGEESSVKISSPPSTGIVEKKAAEAAAARPEVPVQVQEDVEPSLPPVSVPEPPTTMENQPEVLMADNAPGVIVEDNLIVQEDNKWYELLPLLGLGGMAKQLAEHCLFKEELDGKIVLFLDNTGVTLQTSRTEEALTESLGRYFDKEIRLEFDVSDSIGETPEKRRIRLGKERQHAAEQSIEQDLFVNELRNKWGGVVIPGSVRPNQNIDTF